ncbi:uncharacterized protein AMSG_00630 [Thecamonas trahens ATCC 50062]|uniref:Uncharacterized protein n=1 Tax=Thecamonas trahens ATCC 50062 TaxID=461836 RepID=A0A0L0DDP4_THETB|nr:hypothetical protein AMSG_00630 [Thecamonas trahens ATCC 50062]KNC50467.1 hypothetical protein AMSG_00630 [Thecamonas trahens ATCC 50062]|eukprot:XP_013762363.1 hypothetical protein AMSG_00630 [Thecamonas trahens ATCC 50062]
MGHDQLIAAVQRANTVIRSLTKMIHALEAQRDALQTQLVTASSAASSASHRPSCARCDGLEVTVTHLLAQVDALRVELDARDVEQIERSVLARDVERLTALDLAGSPPSPVSPASLPHPAERRRATPGSPLAASLASPTASPTLDSGKGRGEVGTEGRDLGSASGSPGGSSLLASLPRLAIDTRGMEAVTGRGRRQSVIDAPPCMHCTRAASMRDVAEEATRQMAVKLAALRVEVTELADEAAAARARADDANSQIRTLKDALSDARASISHLEPFRFRAAGLGLICRSLEEEVEHFSERALLAETKLKVYELGTSAIM